MSLSTDAALRSLQDSSSCAEDPRLDRRLLAIQQTVGDDLGWIEQSLNEAAGQGAAPGTDAARHLIERGGKRMRPLSCVLSAACFGAVPDAARQVAVAVELIHSATLLHDDVIDDGDERRGAQASRRIWGNAVSILAGDMLLVQALVRTQGAAPELMNDLLQTLGTLVDGEIVQLRGRKRLDASETTYERILRDKTASLFRFSAASGARLGGASEEQCRTMAEFGESLGVAFQLVDDALDYSETDTGKTLLSDLREGKMTLPLVLAMAEAPDLVKLVAQVHGGANGAVPESGEEAVIEMIRARVVELGVCSEVRRRARAHTARAVRALERVPEGPARALLQSVAAELNERST